MTKDKWKGHVKMRKGILYKSIIFDLDGTLMNTKAGILKSLDCVIESRGYPQLSEERKKKFIGPPMFQSLRSEYGLSDDEAYSAAQEFRDLYAGDYCLMARTYPMMRTLLTSLKHEGCKLSVATYKREDVANRILAHFKLDPYFDAIYGSDFEGRLSKKDIIEKAMNHVGVRPANTVVIGDSKSDGAAANQIGVKFIAVTYGFGFNSEKDAADLHPIAICRRAEDIYFACRKFPQIKNTFLQNAKMGELH